MTNPSTWPAWLAAATLVLGVYRIARLIGWDAWPPIAALRDRILQTTVDRSMTERRPNGEPARRRYGRPTLAEAIRCPFCAAFWIGLVVYGCWLVVPTETLYVLAPFALSAAVGLIGRNLDP